MGVPDGELNQVVVRDPVVILLAPGDTNSAKANARGHLFESFMAQVLHHLGYREPATTNLNTTAEGVELDISLTNALDGSHAIAECKAYSSNVNVGLLAAFYGRLAALRLDPAQAHLKGFFFAIPRLTAEANEQALRISASDHGFRTLDAATIWTLLHDQGLISRIDQGVVSDHALSVHASGVYSAALEIDPASRMATRVLIRAKSGGVASDAISLLADHPYAQGLAILDVSASLPTQTVATTPPAVPVVVTVHGSSSDFEYQLPASPRYFVGRGEAVRELVSHLEGGRGPFVLNAQSGWGKSSLALMVASKNVGLSFVFDTRTASSPAYVAAAIRQAALAGEGAGLLSLPLDASWATLAGALRSLRDSTWSGAGDLLVIFDQFENAFADAALTSEFRDAALWNAENPEHVTIAFAWKTDYVDWIESHPYRLRDQIRDASKVVRLTPFGSREVETVLRRLETAVGSGLSRELRQRLREYSQGLPWLLKKLSGHVISEMASGKSQEQLIGEALNVQNLFDSDLAALTPQEREALNFVARYAPVRAAEVTERFTAGLVQSLLNQRLVVQVGEKIDTYWDIFRDYLNSGRVPIADSYILRLTPNSVARLVSELLARGGSAASSEVADAWETSENVVWNSVRELRQLGLASSSAGVTTLATEIVGSVEPERELRLRVANALRRHRAYTEFAELSERGQGRVEVPTFAARLRDVFPAVQGTQNTWTVYARTFLAWFEYAGLVVAHGAGFAIAPEGAPGRGALTARSASIVRTGAFPTRAPGPALDLLRRSNGQTVEPTADRRQYFRELVALGAVTVSAEDPMRGAVLDGLVVDGEIVENVLLALLRNVIGGAEAVEAVESNSAVRSAEIGRIFEAALGTSWTDSTRDLVGKSFFGWARAAGLSTRRRSRRRRASPVDSPAPPGL